MISGNSQSFSVPLSRAELFTRKVPALRIQALVAEVAQRVGGMEQILSGAVTLRIGGAQEGCPVDIKLCLLAQPCRFGGHRWWATCPGCRRRVAILYLVGGSLPCRKCQGLKYLSKTCSDVPRLMHHYARLREELERRPGPKPRRYWQYLKKENRYTEQVIRGLIRFGKKLDRRRAM